MTRPNGLASFNVPYRYDVLDADLSNCIVDGIFVGDSRCRLLALFTDTPVSVLDAFFRNNNIAFDLAKCFYVRHVRPRYDAPELNEYFLVNR